jgi:hypothetical protein
MDMAQVTRRRLMGSAEQLSRSLPKRMAPDSPDSTSTLPILIPWLILGYYFHSFRIYPEPVVL